MPADPYTLGIGVEIDESVTQDALGRFTTSIQAGIEDLSDLVSESFDSLHDAIFGMEDAEEASESLDVMTEAMTRASESADKLAEALIPIAVGQSPSILIMLQQGAMYAGRSLTDLAFAQLGLLKPAEELEAATARIAYTMGGSSQQAQALTTDIINLTATTRFSLEATTQLATGLSETGQTLGSFSQDTQVALSNLNTVFGVSGQEAGHAAVTLRGFGSDIGAVLGQATDFTKRFGVPGVFKELPGIVQGAHDAVLRFGSAIVGSGADIVRATIQTGMAFTKTFGTTIAESVSKAQASMEKFGGQAQQDRRVFLGMATDFSELTKSIMQTGRGLHESMELVRAGADGGADAALALGNVLDGITNPFLRGRFVEQLRDELTPEMFALATNAEHTRDRFLEAEAEARRFADSTGGQGVEAFNALGKGVMGVTSELRKMLGNMFDLTKATIGNIAISLGLPKILEDVTKRVSDLALKIHAFTQSEEFKEKLEEWKPTILSVGKAVLGFAAIAGPALSALGSGFMALRMIPGLEAVVKTFGGVIGKIFGKVGPIGLAVGAFQGLKTAVMDMGAVLGNPNATGMEKFESLVRGGLKGIGSFFDTILLGIPGRIVEYFFPDLEMRFEVGVSSFMDRISGFFSGGSAGVVESVSQTIGGWMKSLGDFMLDHLPDIRGFVASFGRMFGSAIGGAVRFGVGIMMDVWNTEWALVKTVLTGSGVEGGDGIADGIMMGLEGLAAATQVVWDGIKTFAVEAFDGLLRAFGTSTTEMWLRFKIAFEKIRAFGDRAWNRVSDGVNNLADRVAIGLSYLVEGAEVTWTKFAGAIRLQHATLTSLLVGDFTTIGTALQTALTWSFKVVKAAGLSMFQTIKDGLYNMAVTAVDTFMRMFNPLSFVMPGVKEAVRQLGLVQTEVTATRETQAEAERSQVKVAEQEAAVLKKRVDEVTAVTGNRLLLIQEETDAQVAGIEARARAERASLQERIEQRAQDTKLDEENQQRRLNDLEQQLAATTAARERQQAQEIEAHRTRGEFAKVVTSKLESALQELDATGEKMGASWLDKRSASQQLRSFMSEQSKTLAEEVAKGSITLEEATAKLADSLRVAKLAAESKLKAKTPGEVAEAAAGKPEAAPAAGTPAPLNFDRRAVAALMRQARSEVRVSLQGGDNVTRALARQSNVTQRNQNGG